MISERKFSFTFVIVIAVLSYGCNGDNVSKSETQSETVLTYNREAPIPPQCYTRTESRFNPCYTCHQSYTNGRANKKNDGDLQGDYSFSWLGATNHWTNLFKDCTQAIESITDTTILDYINQDNYTPLANRLAGSPNWQGFVPDIANWHQASQAFDEHGLALDGSAWVAFNYKPFPSTFWPTNGSTDDVLLRLPEKFRQSCNTESTAFSFDAYYANLGLLEATIKELNAISIPLIDENRICQDLNGDGVLGKINRMTVLPDHYVGGASSEKRYNGLYPLGTEFLHSVRYIGVDQLGEIAIPPRMKELRYMKKNHFFTPGQLAGKYELEELDKGDEIIPTYTNTGAGLANSFGWLVLGFIEDQQGQLRQQTHEENKYCMGCHSSIGSTIDQTFAFARKITGADGWKYIDLKGMKDAPVIGEKEGEILTYLKRVGGGSEFRNNREMQTRWFKPDGRVDIQRVQDSDVYNLITPSRKRALQLNKAYKQIVDEQSYIYGREAPIEPVPNVYRKVPVALSPLPPSLRKKYDLRLHWEP